MITIINSSRIPKKTIREVCNFVGLKGMVELRVMHTPGMYCPKVGAQVSGQFSMFEGIYIVQLANANDIGTLVHELRHAYQAQQSKGYGKFINDYLKPHNRKVYEHDAEMAEHVYMTEYYNKGA